MKEEDYLIKIAELEKDFNKAKYQLSVEFAMSNNTYPIGSILTDHKETIRVDKIKVEMPFMSKIPCCVYYGVGIKKDGKPMKDGSIKSVWGKNVKSVITKP